MRETQIRNRLSEKEIKTYLKDKSLPITVLETIDSTNEEAKRRKLPYGLIISEEQTSGKGQREKSFYSPKYDGIYMSYVLSKQQFQFPKSLPLPLLCAVAVSQAIASMYQISPEIKWVNDLYYNNKKICGILCERILSPDTTTNCVIFGIGINVTTKEFPQELEGIAGSLPQGNNPPSKNQLIAKIIEQLNCCLKTDEQILLKQYKSLCGILNQKITVTTKSAKLSAIAKDILPDGSLLILDERNQLHQFYSGDISIKKA